jgi:hypothetical protein
VNVNVQCKYGKSKAMNRKTEKRAEQAISKTGKIRAIS